MSAIEITSLISTSKGEKTTINSLNLVTYRAEDGERHDENVVKLNNALFRSQAVHWIYERCLDGMIADGQ